MSYKPSKKIRKYIAYKEGSDFIGQNASFNGDAVGAKWKELEYILGNTKDKFNNDQKDALLSYYYNTVPKNFKRLINPALSEIRKGNTDKGMQMLSNSFTIGYNRTNLPGLRIRRDEERNLFTGKGLVPGSKGYVYKQSPNYENDGLIMEPIDTVAINKSIKLPDITGSIEKPIIIGNVQNPGMQQFVDARNATKRVVHNLIKDNMDRMNEIPLTNNNPFKKLASISIGLPPTGIEMGSRPKYSSGGTFRSKLVNGLKGFWDSTIEGSKEFLNGLIFRNPKNVYKYDLDNQIVKNASGNRSVAYEIKNKDIEINGGKEVILEPTFTYKRKNKQKQYIVPVDNENDMAEAAGRILGKHSRSKKVGNIVSGVGLGLSVPSIGFAIQDMYYKKKNNQNIQHIQNQKQHLNY